MPKGQRKTVRAFILRNGTELRGDGSRGEENGQDDGGRKTAEQLGTLLDKPSDRWNCIHSKALGGKSWEPAATEGERAQQNSVILPALGIIIPMRRLPSTN